MDIKNEEFTPSNTVKLLERMCIITMEIGRSGKKWQAFQIIEGLHLGEYNRGYPSQLKT